LSVMVAPTATGEGRAGTVFLAIGVLSQVSQPQKRQMVRSNWGRQPGEGNEDVMTRFVLCEAANAGDSRAIREEHAMHGDLLVLPDAQDGNLYATKGFGWLRVALRRWKPRFVALADDDAYLQVDALVADLRLAMRTLGPRASQLALGAVEWFGYDRATGRVGGWGRGPSQASHAWRKLHEPGPAARPGLSLPFPFLKGPLMVYGHALAATLSTGNHSRHEMAAVRSMRDPPRVIVDAFFGHVLASDQGGNGSQGLVLIDMDRITGFREMRPSFNLTEPRMGCLRVLHMGTTTTYSVARRSNRTIDAVRRAWMARMAAHRPSVFFLPKAASLDCAPAQPYYAQHSNGLLTQLGSSWALCALKYKQTCLSRPPGSSGTLSASRTSRGKAGGGVSKASGERHAVEVRLLL